VPQPRRPIRLALVITELAVGGAERNLVRLATGLSRSEFDVRVFSLKTAPLAPRNELVEALQAAGVPVQFLNARAAWQVPLATRRLAAEFKAWRPDVVQSFLFHANMVSTWACQLAGKPKLVWGLRVADPNPRRQWLERRFIDRADTVVCVSQSVKDFALEKLAIDEGKLLVIPNGIDVETYKAALPIPLEELGVASGRRMLLCVGRLHEQKGYDWLLSFAPQLLAQLPEHDLVFVGEGPQRRRLEALATASGVGERIHFTGFRNDTPRCIAAADILLLPSRWEGMPNVVLEAMACGRPVVAAASHGVAEALGKADQYQLLSFQRADDFRRNVVAIATDNSLGFALGAANQTRALASFSQTAMLASFRQLYRSLALT
jgi:glycosyltransferase involved in cell wall biosynthesis